MNVSLLQGLGPVNSTWWAIHTSAVLAARPSDRRIMATGRIRDKCLNLAAGDREPMPSGHITQAPYGIR